MSGQQQLQKSKVFRFLEKLANSTSEVNSTEQKIIQHKIKRSRFLENRKKIQQAMKRQAEKLDMVKKEIDNIDCSIAELKNIMENNVNSAQDDMNVK
jgi:chromosome segregation ATPase